MPHPENGKYYAAVPEPATSKISKRKIWKFTPLTLLLLLVPAGAAAGVGTYYYYVQTQNPCQQITYSMSPGWSGYTVGAEAFNMESAVFASNSTQVVLYLRNTGTGTGPTAIDNVILRNTGSQSMQILSISPGLSAQPFTLAPGDSKLVTTLQSGNITLVTSLGVNNEVHLCYQTVEYVPPTTAAPQPPASFTSSLVAYYVKDSSGNQWAMVTWNGPTTRPTQLAVAVINIGSSSGATYSGGAGAFNTFAAGYGYTITVVTARNNQFTYVVVR